MFPYGDNVTIGKLHWGIIVIILLLSIVNFPLFFIKELQDSAINSGGFFPIIFSLKPLLSCYRFLTAVVLHANFFHLFGNCIFLIAFGKTLERLFGWKLLLCIFPLLGIGGFLLEWALHPDSTIPVIGASGAIAALMGAYLPLFPNAKIRMIFFGGWFWKRFTLPAWIFLPYWIGLQLVSIALGYNDGVAYSVHAGSFAAGVIAAIVWKTSYPFAEEKLSQLNAAIS